MRNGMFLLMLLFTFLVSCGGSEGKGCINHSDCNSGYCNPDNSTCEKKECEEWRELKGGECVLKAGKCDSIGTTCNSETEVCNENLHACITNPCNNQNCSDHGVCKISSIDFSAFCDCNDGYKPQGLTCVQNDFCENANCSEWEQCNPLNGICEIKDGRCISNSNCTNQICNTNTYTCIFDPCINQSCSNHGDCYVSPNDFSANCECENGYSPEGLTCIQDDLCLNVNCSDWEQCKAGVCNLKEGRCSEESHCSSWKSCDLNSHECILDENRCDSDLNCNNGQICSSSRYCVDCISGDERVVSCGFLTLETPKTQICNQNNSWEDISSCPFWVKQGIDQFNSGEDYISSIANDGSNIIVLGKYYGRYFMRKYSKDGELIWVNNFDTASESKIYPNNIYVDSSSNIFIVGYHKSVDFYGKRNGCCENSSDCATITNSDKNRDSILVKYNSFGAFQWAEAWGNSYNEEAYFISTTPSGDIFVSGNKVYEYDYDNTTQDVFVKKFHSDGTPYENNVNTFGSNYQDEYLYGMDLKGDSLVIVGYSDYQNGNFLMMSFDISVNNYSDTVVESVFGTPNGREFLTDIKFGNSGEYYLLGNTDASFNNSSLIGENDIILMKYNSNNSLVWTKHIGTPYNEYSTGVELDLDGNIYVLGDTEGIFNTNNQTIQDVFIAKYNSSGERLSLKQFGSEYIDTSYCFFTDNEKNIFVGGQTEGSFNNFVKYNGTILYNQSFERDYRGELFFAKFKIE